ncbi:MAG: 6-bladed beta-propeller [Rikenellaceae bacterium]
MSDIESILHINNKLHIKDSEAGVLLFDNDGVFIKKIAERGRGRAEYISSNAFAVNSQNKILSIIDDNKNKLINYSIENYDYIDETPTPVISYNMEAMGNITVWYNDATQSQNEETDFNYIITNKDVVVQKFSPKLITNGFATGPEDQMYIYSDCIRAYAQHSPYVYSIDINGECSVKYEIKIPGIDFAPERYLKEIASTSDYMTFYDYLSDSGYISYSRIMESDESLLYLCYIDNIAYIGIYDKTKQSAKITKVELLKQLNGMELGYLCGTYNCDKYIFAIDPQDYKTQRTKNDCWSEKFNSQLLNANNNLSLLIIKFNLVK